MHMNRDLFRKIRVLRKKNNFSQEYMARELGMSRPTYIQIEKGERELTITEAKKLAAIFSISLENLLTGEAPRYKVSIEKRKVDNSSVTQIRVTEKDLEKFKQVLLYVLGKVGSKPNVGETVLHKLLYFIDFDYYEKFEENLIGATYIKNHHGPTSVELKDIIGDMQKNREIEAVKKSVF